MDSLTHIALGAVTGDLILGKKLGKKAMLLGAIANCIPDIDVVASLWLAPADNLLAHRGITHSILFAGISSILLFVLARKWDQKRVVRNQGWVYFFLIQLSLHLFVDLFNAYGIGLLIPFSEERFSFNSIYVVDPIFSIILITTAVILSFTATTNSNRFKIITVCLTLILAYLSLSIVNKSITESSVKRSLTKSNINYHRLLTTPTPFNTLLWFIVVESGNGFHLGYHSIFDTSDTINYTFIPKNEALLINYQNQHDLLQLKKFSQGYYSIEHYADTLVFNDLRFGQITGWQNAHARFVFHYYLNYPDENKTVMQRGRFTNWNKETIQSLYHKMLGK